jgi:hypothetical protein
MLRNTKEEIQRAIDLAAKNRGYSIQDTWKFLRCEHSGCNATPYGYGVLYSSDSFRKEQFLLCQKHWEKAKEENEFWDRFNKADFVERLSMIKELSTSERLE